MNIDSLKRFKKYQGNITVYEGTNLYQGHIKINYPEYRGDKMYMFHFYNDWANKKGVTKSQLNDTLYTIVDNVIYETI